MVPKFKGRMPTSFSQEAGGQLKNKDTVINRTLQRKNCIHRRACNIKIPNTKSTHKTEGRKVLPASHDLTVGEEPYWAVQSDARGHKGH